MDSGLMTEIQKMLQETLTVKPNELSQFSQVKSDIQLPVDTIMILLSFWENRRMIDRLVLYTRPQTISLDFNNILVKNPTTGTDVCEIAYPEPITVRMSDIIVPFINKSPKMVFSNPSVIDQQQSMNVNAFTPAIQNNVFYNYLKDLLTKFSNTIIYQNGKPSIFRRIFLYYDLLSGFGYITNYSLKLTNASPYAAGLDITLNIDYPFLNTRYS